MGRNTIVAQEQLFMPRFIGTGGARVKNYSFVGFYIVFLLLQHDTLKRWSVGRDGLNVTYKKTAGGVILLLCLCLCIFAFFVLALCCTHFNARTLLHEHS